jgi:serine/threonine protein kinase
MSRWLQHTQCVRIGDQRDDANWRQAADRSKAWRQLTGLDGKFLEINARYRDEELAVLGYGAFGVVFKGARKLHEYASEQKYTDVVVKMFISRNTTTRSAATREARALLFLQQSVPPELNTLCQPGLICYVDHFIAVVGKTLLHTLYTYLYQKSRQSANYRASESSSATASPSVLPPPSSSATVTTLDPRVESLIVSTFPKMDHYFKESGRGAYFIETLALSGHTLDDIQLKDGISGATLPFTKNLNMMLTAAQALEFMHTHGIVHSDIKPDNIFVSHLYDGALDGGRGFSAAFLTTALPECTLIDVGLACRADVTKVSAKEAESDVGTCSAIEGARGYVAPTQMRLAAFERATRPDLISFERRASWDVYALGLSFRDFGLGINVNDLRRKALQANEVTKEFIDSFNDTMRVANPFSRVPTAPHFHEQGDNADRALSRVISTMVRLKDSSRATIVQVVKDLEQLKAQLTAGSSTTAAVDAGTSTAKTKKKTASESEQQKPGQSEKRARLSSTGVGAGGGGGGGSSNDEDDDDE